MERTHDRAEGITLSFRYTFALSLTQIKSKKDRPTGWDVSSRKYPDMQIVVQLIHEPKPENWPCSATPMPTMAQGEALKFDSWINFLK